MIGTTAEILLSFNRHQSNKFIQHRPLRQEHRKLHPTGVRWFRCMDSRGDPNYIFEGLPFGLGRSYQNIGAIFKPNDWKRFRASVQETKSCLQERGRPTLFVTASHYSKTDKQLGCKGHQFNAKRARDASHALKRQLDAMFVGDFNVCTICVAIDTDENGITLYGNRGDMFDVATAVNASSDFIRDEVRKLKLQIREPIFTDLVDLLVRNKKHIARMKQKSRVLADIDHHESMIFVGQSPEAICSQGSALVINPFDPNFPEVVTTAGAILQSNLKKYGLQKGHRLALVAATPYHPSADAHLHEARKRRAKIAIQDLAGRAAEALRTGVPQLRHYLEYVSVVVSMDTMLAEAFD